MPLGTVYKRDDVYYISYYKNGRRVRESAKTGSKREAQALLTERIQAERPSALRCAALFDTLERELEQREIKSLMKTLSHLRPVRRHFDTHRAEDVDRAALLGYTQKRRQEGVSSATVNRELTLMGQALRLAHREGLLNRLPVVQKLPEHNVRQGFFTDEDIQALIPHLPDYLHGPVLFAYRTGWRRGEVAALRWEMVDRNAHTVSLTGAQTKDGYARTLRLPPVVWKIIQAQWSDRDGPFVFHYKGRPLGDFRKTWRKAVAAAGLEGKLFHDLRRSAVRNLVKAGVPTQVAQRVSGHRTRSVFDRYAITGSDDAYEALVLVTQGGEETLSQI